MEALRLLLLLRYRPSGREEEVTASDQTRGEEKTTTLLLNLWQSFPPTNTHARTRYYYLPAMAFLLLLIAFPAPIDSGCGFIGHVNAGARTEAGTV